MLTRQNYRLMFMGVLCSTMTGILGLRAVHWVMRQTLWRVMHVVMVTSRQQGFSDTKLLICQFYAANGLAVPRSAPHAVTNTSFSSMLLGEVRR